MFLDKMALGEHLRTIFKPLRDFVPALSSGIMTVVLFSCLLFCIQTCCDLTPGFLSVGSGVFLQGHIHTLLLYPFHHRTLAQLLLNISALVLLSSSLEKGVGTVRFIFLFLLMSSTIGLVYSFLDLLQDGDGLRVGPTEGLIPVTLACVALTTMHTKMTKGFLCGVSFPTMALPWVFLIITTALVPHCVLPCNVVAILVGWMCGKGWFSLLEVSEARAGVLEKTVPFRWLRRWRVRGVGFVPASTEERRKTLLPQINPTPGSYPVQAYAPVSSVHPAHNTALMYEGWPHVTTTTPSSPIPPMNTHGHETSHSCGHTHGHLAEFRSFDHSSQHNHGHSHSHEHSHSHGHSQ